MKKSSVLVLLTLTGICLVRCRLNNQKNVGSNPDSSQTVIYPSDTISKFRKSVKKEPVAEFRERTDNPLNKWYFSVRLYETPKTFQYLLKMEFEEITGEDTLKLPNFGITPRPEIRKGKDKYSCIIGFIDKDNNFREYKKVFINDGIHLRLVALNHYSVVVSEDKREK